MKISRIAVALLLPLGFALAQKAPSNEGAGKAQATTAQPGTVGEVKTYKGELVDASCATGGATATASSAKSSGQSAADRSSTSQGKSAGKSGEANRSDSQSCAATSGTNEFGLRTKDGNTLRFDSVGNDRAKEAISAKKKWSDAIASGKPVQIAVSGAESSDRLTVVSIH